MRGSCNPRIVENDLGVAFWAVDRDVFLADQPELANRRESYANHDTKKQRLLVDSIKNEHFKYSSVRVVNEDFLQSRRASYGGRLLLALSPPKTRTFTRTNSYKNLSLASVVWNTKSEQFCANSYILTAL